MELTTTRAPGGALTTTTPGAPASAFAALAPTFVNLIRKRIQDAQGVQKPAATGALKPSYAQSDAGGYAPQLASAPVAPQPASMTRMVADPRVSPFYKYQTGQEPPAVMERYIPGFGWEFSDLRPHGSSGGIIGGGLGTSALSSSGLSGGAGPADPVAANAGYGATQTDTGYTPAVQAQQQRAEEDRVRKTGSKTAGITPFGGSRA